MFCFSRWARFVAVLCCVLAAPSFAEQAEEIAKARALMEEGKYKEAFDLLVEKATDERMAEDPAFMLVAADVLWRHAPSQPALVPNAGDQQSKMYEEAAELYRDVIDLKSASKAQKEHALDGLDDILDTLEEKIEAIRKDKEQFPELARLVDIMLAVEPMDPYAPTLIYQLGEERDDDRMILAGLRMLVKTKSEDENVYTYAASMETIAENGDGAEAAIAHIDAGLAVLPDNLSLLHERARWLIEVDRMEDALKATVYFDKMINERVQDKGIKPILLVSTGVFYEKLGKTDEAIERMESAIEINPAYLKAHYHLGSLHFTQGIDSLLQIPDQTGDDRREKIKALRAEATASLKAARPRLEYFHEHSPKHDTSVMGALQEIYNQLGEEANAMKMMKDIKKVQRGEPIR